MTERERIAHEVDLRALAVSEANSRATAQLAEARTNLAKIEHRLRDADASLCERAARVREMEAAAARKNEAAQAMIAAINAAMRGFIEAVT